MNLLYLGKYRRRFEKVISLLKELPENTRILELCFGDIYIADFCRKAGLTWTGLDINGNFVRQAKTRGYNAYVEDITALKVLPKADVCIMMGSLYHFHPETGAMLAKMVASANTIVVSEPVLNLSSSSGLVGFFAKRSANAGKGHERFRFNESSLLNLLKENSNSLNYRVAFCANEGKDLIVKLVKNANC